MKTKNIIIAAALALAGTAVCLIAQDFGGKQQGQQDQGQGGSGMRGHRPPPSPLVAVLDANHDGVIDADEIANASAALKKLDKNGDGKLTPDEFCPPRPQGRDGGEQGEGRPPGGPDDAPPQQQN